MSFDLSPEKLALLDAALTGGSTAATIERRPDRSTAPLSFAQERLWFIDRLVPDSPAYNIPLVLELEGPVDAAAIGKAIETLGARHEMLRAHVELAPEGRPRWRIEGEPSVRLTTREVSATEAERIEAEQATAPFDLERGPLWRVTLLRLGDTEHRLLLTMHHIVSEAWTCALLLRQLCALLRGETLPPLELDYGDFAAWQREHGVDEAGLTFFREHLASPPVLELPTDHARRAERRHRGGWVERFVSTEATAAIKALGQRHRATLYMTLLAGFDVLLHRYSGQRDLVVGSPVSLRDRVELEGMVGFFVNTVGLRQSVDPTASFAALLEDVRDTALDVFAHRAVPFEKVVDALGVKRTMAQSPVIQVALVVQDTPEQADWRRALSLEGVRCTPRIRPSDTSKFDLTLEAEELDGRLRLAIEYDSDLFEPETAAAMLAQLERLLSAAAAEPSTPVADLPLLSDEERRTILEDWNPAPRPAPTRPIHAFVADAAERDPTAIAVSEGERQLSYGELMDWTRAIAARLQAAGVRPGDRVAILAPRSMELVAAMLGVLRAGAAYMPVDRDYPEARVRFMLDDGGATVALVPTAQDPVPEGSARVAIGSATDDAGPLAEVSVEPDDLAYVLFTSGSTGRPKGVLTPHRGIVRLVRDTDYVTLGPETVTAQVASASFDAITFEVWGALANGGRVAILPSEEVLDPARLEAALKREGVTDMFLTAALFNRVAHERPRAFASVDTLIIGGEALDPPSVRRVLEGGGPPHRLRNGYGPTEVTTFSTTHPIDRVSESASSIPIGRPIANTSAHVLDDHLSPVPPGVPGELYLGGPGVALGYLERPELSAERFVPNPFGPGRLYRTGDLVRWRRDGLLDFIARRDRQVKLRGFRIELGEIEARLSEHPSVEQSVCVVRGQRGERRIVGYVRGAIEPEEARAYLGARLPGYMVPAAFVTVDAFPLDPNGKVDRSALPDPRQVGERAPLRSPTERTVARAFAATLHIEDLKADDDFFALGGSSLLAVPLFRDLGEHFGFELPLATLFRASTIAGLAGEIDRIRDEGAGEAEVLRFGPLPTGRFEVPTFDPLVTIQPEGARRALYCVHGAGGNVVGFRHLASHLGNDQPFYGLQARGIDGVRRPHETIEAMARAYADAIEAHDPAGPYVLAGYSGGGVIAFELARRLTARGREVAKVIMLDAGAGRAAPETAAERQRRRLSGLRRGGLAFVRDKIEERVEWDRWRLRAAAAEAGKWLGHPIPAEMRNRMMIEAFTRARNRYTLRPLDVPVYVLSAELGTREAVACAELGWRSFAPRVRAFDVPGDHGTLLDEPDVRELARVVRRCLD